MRLRPSSIARSALAVLVVQVSLAAFTEGTFEHKIRTELTSIDRGIGKKPTHERLLSLTADEGKSRHELQDALLALIDYHRSHPAENGRITNYYIAANAISALAMVGDVSIVPKMVSIIAEEERELLGPALGAAIYPSFRADPDTLYSTIAKLVPIVEPSALYSRLGNTLENVPPVRDGNEEARRDILLAFLFKAWELRLSDDVTYLDGVLARNDSNFKSSDGRVQRLKQEALGGDDFVRRYSVRMLAELGVTVDSDLALSLKDLPKLSEERHGNHLEGKAAEPEIARRPLGAGTSPSRNYGRYVAFAAAAAVAMGVLLWLSRLTRR